MRFWQRSIEWSRYIIPVRVAVCKTTAGEAGRLVDGHHSMSLEYQFPCTNMLERDVIFGGLDRLRETINGTIEII